MDRSRKGSKVLPWLTLLPSNGTATQNFGWNHVWAFKDHYWLLKTVVWCEKVWIFARQRRGLSKNLWSYLTMASGRFIQNLGLTKVDLRNDSQSQAFPFQKDNTRKWRNFLQKFISKSQNTETETKLSFVYSKLSNFGRAYWPTKPTLRSWDFQLSVRGWQNINKQKIIRSLNSMSVVWTEFHGINETFYFFQVIPALFLTYFLVSTTLFFALLRWSCMTMSAVLTIWSNYRPKMTDCCLPGQQRRRRVQGNGVFACSCYKFSEIVAMKTLRCPGKSKHLTVPEI